MTSYSALRNPLLFVEIAIIAGMLATAFIPPVSGIISVWSEIPALLYLRAFFWIPGLLVLPGLSLVRLIPPLSAQPRIAKIVLAPIISFALFGTLAVVLNVVGALGSLPWVALALVAALEGFARYKTRDSPPFDLRALDPRGMHKGYFILLAAALASIAMAIGFQITWQYGYPQDTWVSFLSGIKLITGRSAVEAFSTSFYPISFGYIIAGLSLCTGFPLVNAQALLIPFTALEVLSLFTLARVVFGRGIYTSSLAALIFGFCGGFGWMVLLSRANWQNLFMYISNLTKDMYFGPFFFYSYFFYYKSLALMMAFASVIIFSISGRTEVLRCKISTAVLSSFLIVWAFLIHMLPALLAPMVVVMALIFNERRQQLKSLLVYIISAAALLLAMDLMMEGVYVDLIFVKGVPLISAVLGGRTLLVAAGLAGALAVALVLFFLMRRGSLKMPEKNPLGSRLKLVVALALLAVYLAGGLFFSYSTYSVSSSAVFPWYLYVTRYGFIGILAILGIYTSRWKAEWFKVCVVWAIIAIAMGSLWWGERLNSYLFPVVAILAGGALVNLFNRASPSKAPTRAKAGRRDPRWVLVSALLLVGLAISFGSAGASAYNFFRTPQLITDDIVHAYNWAAVNATYEDGFVGYAYPFTLSYGISTLSDRHVVGDTSLASFTVDNATGLAANLTARGVKYIAVEEGNPFNTNTPSILKVLQSYSDTVFRSGKITIAAIPQLSLPDNSSQVAVLDWGQLETLRFLAVSVPALWPTGYSVVHNSSLAANASVVFAPIGSTINSTILNFANSATVVLISSNLNAPGWGTGWAPMIPGTLEGAFEGRRVIIIDSTSASILGNLTAFSQGLYGEIFG